MKNLIYLNLFFIFQPYIGISIFPSDIQPFALITSIIIFFLYFPKNNFSIPFFSISFLLIFLLASISFFYLSFSFNSLHDFVDRFRYYFGYMTPFFTVTSLYYIFKIKKLNLIIPVLDLILYLSILGILLNVLGLTSIIQIFVNRAIVEEVYVARGFSSFYPEQSRIPEQMSIIYFIYLIFNSLSKKRLVLLFLLAFLSFAGQFFVQIFLISFSYFLVKFIIVLYRMKIKKYQLFLSSVLLILIINFNNLIDKIYNVFIFFGLPRRGVEAIYEISKYGITYLSQDKGFILKTSGFIAAISSLIVFPFNFELGSFSNESFRNSILDIHYVIQSSIYNNSFPIMEDRSGSPLGTWVIDFGVLGFLISLFFLFNLFFKSFKSFLYQNISIYLWASFFLVFMLLIKLPLANPSIWGLVSIIFIKSNQTRSL